MDPVIGIDLGGTTLRTGVVAAGAVVWERRTETRFSRAGDAGGAEAAGRRVLESLERALAEALDEHPGSWAIGLGVAGFVDAEQGRLRSSPNLPGVADLDLAGPLGERFGLPVVVENDALAAAWGEFQLRPGAPSSLLYLGLGTGIGGGLILDGEPWRGARGLAMEVGHLIVEPGGRACGCGNRGCVERYASASGVALSYAGAVGEDLDAATIAARARSGDPAARAALARAGTALAVAVAHLLKVVDPGELVIGGGLSAAWPLMRPAFDERLDRELSPALRGRPAARVSAAGDRAGVLGAALLAARRLAG